MCGGPLDFVNCGDMKRILGDTGQFYYFTGLHLKNLRKPPTSRLAGPGREKIFTSKGLTIGRETRWFILLVSLQSGWDSFLNKLRRCDIWSFSRGSWWRWKHVLKFGIERNGTGVSSTLDHTSWFLPLILRNLSLFAVVDTVQLSPQSRAWKWSSLDICSTKK